ncbi:MAG TPA: quinone oxidoreductase [Sphingomicrobium sp.]
MMKALVFDSFGGPEVLQFRELPDPAVPSGHVQLAMRAIGLNFADLHRRRGNYFLPGKPPHINGYEGAGVVVAIGEGVEGIAIGDRIGFADCPFANATRVNVPLEKAIPLPDHIGFVDAAAMLLQGLTAQYLVEDSYAVRPGDTLLIHAAGGGVGQALIQLAREKGARVLALASTPAKRSIASRLGAEACFDYDSDWPALLRDLTESGLDAVYDSVGTTFLQSLSCLRERGTLVAFGTAGGAPPPIEPQLLMERSLSVVGGDLWNYLDSREARIGRAERLFQTIPKGTLKIPQIETYPLQRGADAHRRMEDRAFFGKIVMTA